MDFLTENAQLIVLVLTAVYEIIIRIKPTSKSLSLLNLVIQFIDKLVPNIETQGGRFKNIVKTEK